MTYTHLDGGLELYSDAVNLTNEAIRRDVVFQWRGGRKFWKLLEILPSAVHVGPFPYVALRDQYKNIFYVLIVNDPRANVARFRARISSDFLIKTGLDAVKDFDRLRNELAKLFGVFGVHRQTIKVSRLDLAIDDLFFTVEEVIEADRADLIRARFRTVTTVINDDGNSITFGRGSGSWQVCVYDKTGQETDLAKLSYLYDRVCSDLPESVLNGFKKMPHITRLEFRFKRDILTALNMSTLDEVDLLALLTFGRDNFKVLEIKCSNQKYETISANYDRLFSSEDRVKYTRNIRRPSGQITRRALKCACTIISKHLVKSVSSSLSWSVVADQIRDNVRKLSGSLRTRTDIPQTLALF